jgi:hypothetical protein
MTERGQGEKQMMRAILLLALTAAWATLMPSAAFASADDLATIERQCGVQLKLSPSGCACLRGRASKLKDSQQAFVAAVVTKNKQAQKNIMQTMTVAELTEAGMFMTTAPAQCDKGGG